MATPAYTKCQIGVLGVGSLGRAMAVGLLTCKNPPSMPILLSTDGGATPTHSHGLSEKYGSKVALASNADTIAKSEILLVCVPPEAVGTVLKDAKFRESQVVISVAAIFAVKKLEPLVQPACAVRSLPMVSSEFHSSFTLVCFGDDWKKAKTSRGLEQGDVMAFFEALGTVALAEDDKQLDALGFAGLHQKSMLSLLQSMQLTLQNQGVPPKLAAQTVSKQMRAVCDDAVRAADTAEDEPWEKLRSRGCRGELNQLVCDVLTFSGFFGAYRIGLGVIGLAKNVTEGSKPHIAAVVAFVGLLLAFFVRAAVPAMR